MSKAAEIDYPLQIARVLGVTPEAVETGLLDKPYGDDSRHSYLLDVAQILALLPRPPARLLDLGVGTGWTSRIFARCGYEVVALDISPHMIELARRAAGAHSRGKGQVRFFAHDYEAGLDFGSFDAAVIYDALHHAEDEAAVIANVHAALAPGGVFVTIEPGVGHSTTPNSIETMEKFGTTEKDMDFARQRQIMRAAGFTRVEQYVRLSQLVLGDVTRDRGYAQRDLLEGLLENTLHQGITSVVVARKPLPGETATDDEVVEPPPSPAERQADAERQLYAVHTERNALAEYSRNLEEQHGAVTAHLDEALRQLHTVHAERNTLAGRLESVEAGYATLAARFDEAQRQRDALATRLDEATAECHRLAGTLQAIHASRSWRLVMGLRRLVSGFR